MTWAFDVTSNIPRIKQTGTDTSLSGIATAISAVPTVARSTAYTVAQMVKPPAANGMWYRCSTAGTTSGTAPLYNPVSGGTITDGTAVFTAFLAPDVRTLGTTNHYYMPDFRFSIEGTLTNSNPQQETFTCWDLLLPAMASNFTSGTWATDGVTPRWDGLHFCATRVGSNNADNGSGGLQLQNGQFTFIGGEVQVAGAIGFTAGTTPRSYQTRWRNTKEWGASSSRIRSYTNLAVFRDCEFFDIAYDLFRMPAEFSVKARGSEYLAQYVGGQAGGADAKFTASNLENVDGTYDFDNYFSGWVELYNCKQGAALKVVSQYPNSAFWVRHCVPLFQDIVITAKNTAGAPVQDVRFTATESPTNSPTITITTVSNLKTWDFRTPLSYQTTTNSSGIATSSPVLNVWYWESSFKQSLRFPSSTATYQGRAYNYKTINVPILLGASSAVQASAGMISLDTATSMTEAAALAQTKVTFTPSGANGGTFTSTANHTLKELWSYYRAFISQFANRASNDTWGCVAGNLTTGAWNHVVNSGVTVSGSDDVTSYATTGSVTNNGSITAIYTSSAGTSSTLTLKNVSPAAAVAVWHPSTTATELFQTNASGSAADYTVYYPPGSVGLVKNYARELYGSQRVAGSITLAAGLNTVDFVDIPDVGISNASQSAVAAYTTIEGPSKRYDRTAVFRLSEQGIKLGQIATRSGTSIEGTFSVVVRDDAPAVYSVLGNVITIKAASYDADTKFIKEIVTGGGTFTAFDTELIDIDVEDANGDSSASVQGTVGGLVDVWKCVNGTINADYATGTKIASNISAGKFRFTGTDGFKLIFYDKNSLLARDCSMSKGNYVLGWYVYDAPTGGLTQSQNADFATLVSKVGDIFADVNSVTTGFVENTDNLHALRQAVDAVPGAVRTELATELGRIDVAVSTRSTLTPEDIPEGLTAAQVRTELTPELERIDVAVSTRSTLTAEDIPEGLTAAEVWAAEARTLTEAPGLTNTQAEQLRKVAQLHGIGAELVVTETARTAGDVSQTITTTDEQTTVSAA